MKPFFKKNGFVQIQSFRTGYEFKKAAPDRPGGDHGAKYLVIFCWYHFLGEFTNMRVGGHPQHLGDHELERKCKKIRNHRSDTSLDLENLIWK